MSTAQRSIAHGRAWVAVTVAILMTVAGLTREAHAQGVDGQSPDPSGGPPGRPFGQGGPMDGGPGGPGGRMGGRWGGHGFREPPTVEERVRHLTKELALTPDQAAKVRAVFTASDAEHHALLEKERAARQEAREQIEQVRTKTEAKIADVLTPDQRKKLEEGPVGPLRGRGMDRRPSPAGR
jgi:Spy/CpxP family protein refolding chaperone